MGIDFLKHLSPEQRARIEARSQHFEKDVAEFAALSNEELADKIVYFMKNCEFPGRYQPGDPVYDGVIAHVVIPKVVKRLRGQK